MDIYEDVITAKINKEQSQKVKSLQQYFQKRSLGKVSNSDVVRNAIKFTHEKFICHKDISKENSQLKQRLKLLEEKNSELEKKLNAIAKLINQ